MVAVLGYTAGCFDYGACELDEATFTISFLSYDFLTSVSF